MWWRSRRQRLEDLDAEIRAHLDLAIADRIARGESPSDAARHARAQFGNETTVREVTGDMLPEFWFAQAVRHAARSLMRAPAFTVSATLTLIVGMGAMIAMFAIVYGILLAPLQYPHGDRLVAVSNEITAGTPRRSQSSPAEYFTYRRFARSAADIGIYRTGTGNIWTVTGEGEPQQVAATWISASTIPMLGVQPIVGRSFLPAEDIPRGPDLVIISERMWRDRFGARADVLGKSLYVNDVRREIIGVMPERFRFPAPSTQIWLPVRVDPHTNTAGEFGFFIVARLKPGITPAVAQQDFAAALPRIAEGYPDLAPALSTRQWLDETRPAPVVMALRDDLTGGVKSMLWMLAVAAGFVLLVACANVSNLLMVRADSRQLELAIREALGASAVRVRAPVFVESLLLVAAAGVMALGVAWAAVRALVALGPADVPRLAELHVGAATLVFTALACVVVASLTAIVPMARIHRIASFGALREGGRGGGGSSRSQQRVRATIASLQIALAVVVLAASGLLLRTFRELHRQRPGFDATNVATLWIQLPFARYNGSDSSIARFYARLTDRLAALPGARAVGISSSLPLMGDASAPPLVSFVAEGSSASRSFHRYTTDAGYFAAMGIRMIAGRTFDVIDRQRLGDAIVSRQLVHEVWNDSSATQALGKRFRVGSSGPWYTVIGVMDDVRDRDLSIAPSPTLYFPQVAGADTVTGLRPPRTMALVIRTSGSPTTMEAAAKRVVRELDPTLPAFSVQSMAEIVRASTARLSLTLTLVGAAALITLLLGAIGLYGVVSYVVLLRRHELGIRAALGADPQRLAMSITAQGIVLAIAGGAAGLVAFFVVARLMRAVLFGVTPADPWALSGTMLVLLATATIASWLPARHAATIDPASVLRSD